MKKTDKYSCGIAALVIAAICLLMVGCSEEDGPFFSEEDYPFVRCHIDSINEYTLEDIIGKRLDASCGVFCQNNSVAEVQVDPSTGLHRLVPKELGFTRIELTRNAEKAVIPVQITTDAIDYWVVWERNDSVVCSPGLQDEIVADMSNNQLLPVMSRYARFWFPIEESGQHIVSFSVGDLPKSNFIFDYDKERKIYCFHDIKNPEKKQSLTFCLKSKQVVRKKTYKEATFSCDLTDVYQEKYGAEHVQCVKITYNVINEGYF